MKKEIDHQISHGNLAIKLRSQVPKGKSVLPAVWQMKRKRDIKTRRVKKWKARLNIDGSLMRKGIHYDQNYAPVCTWSAIILLLTLVVTNNWHTKQLDYVLAFTQPPVEKELYMEIPKGVQVSVEGQKTMSYN